MDIVRHLKTEQYIVPDDQNVFSSMWEVKFSRPVSTKEFLDSVYYLKPTNFAELLEPPEPVGRLMRVKNAIKRWLKRAFIDDSG